MNLPPLPLPPLTTNHAYHTSGGHWYKDRKIHDWEEECLYMLMGKVKHIDKQNIIVTLRFYYQNLKEIGKRKNDIDGRIKFCLDLLTKAGVYDDDSLVTDLVVQKRYDPENPRLEIGVV